jgi:putative flippase GtrA
LKTFGRYLLATGFSALMSLGLPVLFVDVFGWRAELAVAAAFVIAFLVNFLIHKFLVFRSAGRVLREFLGFAATNGLMRLVDYAGFLLLYRVAGLHYLVALVAVLTVTSLLRFLAFRRIFGRGAAS